ncbi:MAG: hypothetical protein WC521_09495 [Bdellovibrionales bacterium]
MLLSLRLEDDERCRAGDDAETRPQAVLVRLARGVFPAVTPAKAGVSFSFC